MELNLSISIHNPSREEVLHQKFLSRVRKKHPTDSTTVIEQALLVLTKNEWVIFQGRNKNEFVQTMKSDQGYMVDFPVVTNLNYRRFQFWQVSHLLDRRGFWHTHRYWWELSSKKYEYFWREDTGGLWLETQQLNSRLTAGIIDQITSKVFGLSSVSHDNIQYGSDKWFWW